MVQEARYFSSGQWYAHLQHNHFERLKESQTELASDHTFLDEELIKKLELSVLDTVSNPEAHSGLEVVAFWLAVYLLDPEEIRHPKRMRYTKLRQLPIWL